jgi:hypothetical protein
VQDKKKFVIILQQKHNENSGGKVSKFQKTKTMPGSTSKGAFRENVIKLFVCNL